MTVSAMLPHKDLHHDQMPDTDRPSNGLLSELYLLVFT